MEYNILSENYSLPNQVFFQLFPFYLLLPTALPNVLNSSGKFAIRFLFVDRDKYSGCQNYPNTSWLRFYTSFPNLWFRYHTDCYSLLFQLLPEPVYKPNR